MLEEEKLYKQSRSLAKLIKTVGMSGKSRLGPNQTLCCR